MVLDHEVPVDWPSVTYSHPPCSTGDEHEYPASARHVVLKEVPALNTPNENRDARTTEMIKMAQP